VSEADYQEGVDEFDRLFYERYGRYPEEITLAPPDPRRARIEALAQHGATEGERAAARAALQRIDAAHAHDADRLARDLQDEHDYEDAVAHGEA